MNNQLDQIQATLRKMQDALDGMGREDLGTECYGARQALTAYAQAQHDSRPDTYAHMQLVQRNLSIMIHDLLRRAQQHDQSKLSEPELSAYNEMGARLRTAEYGSDEYRAILRAQKPAIQHHYSLNTHHPEHYSDGIRGMNLLDVLEMLCDWEAAARRKDGHARASMDHNQERFGFSDELKAILLNTLRLIEGTDE